MTVKNSNCIEAHERPNTSTPLPNGTKSNYLSIRIDILVHVRV